MKILQQCKTCPWKKGNKCENIPNYDRSLHEKLIDTIADEDSLLAISQPLVRVMACHYSTNGNQTECVGWLHNQLGAGNNIALRLRMLGSGVKIILDGEQKQSFDETFE